MARDRKRHAGDKKVQHAPPVAASSAPTTTEPDPHPCLIEIVRLLARQTAKADIAAQRSAIAKD